MELYPAIDLLNGHAVRLAQGDYDRVTVYDTDPVMRAARFKAAGARRLHVVDLAGARSGMCDAHHLELIRRVAAETGLALEMGGGIRTLEAARAALEAGADRVIVGTALVTNPELSQAFLDEFGPEGVVAGIDARDGRVAVDGWTETSEIDALELLASLAERGYRHFVYTDIARDGMRTGVDRATYTQAAAATGCPLIVSGGISSLEDCQAVTTWGCDVVEGVISGRALYEGDLAVSDALEVLRSAH